MLPTAVLGSFSNFADVKTHLPHHRWREFQLEGGGVMALSILGGNKETGDVSMLAVIEGGVAPRHEHLDGGVYGEFILTIAGEMHDVTDDGEKIILRPGQVLYHRGGFIHAPQAPHFWFGYFHQPRGSKLA